MYLPGLSSMPWRRPWSPLIIRGFPITNVLLWPRIVENLRIIADVLDTIS